VHEPAVVDAGLVRHVVVCGSDHLAQRTLDELRLRHEQVVAIIGRDAAVPEERLAGIEVIRGSVRDETVLRSARVGLAAAIVLTDDDDLGNVHAALSARQLNPGIRIVLRLFDTQLGSHLGALVENAVALSSSALAAPGFVSAALDGESGGQFELGGRLIRIRQSGGEAAPPAGTVSTAIARLHPDRSVEPLPVGEVDAPGLVIADALPLEGAAGDRAGDRGAGVALLTRLPAAIRERLSVPDRRLVNLALVLIGLAVVSSLFFAAAAGLTPLDAVSYAITLLTGASGSGVDIDPATAPAALKVYGILLSLFGAALIGVVYALITDAIIGSRLLRLLGRRSVPRALRDHVIVCGLGSIGYRITVGLLARGVGVVAVDADEAGRFVSAARSRGVPVMVGDARQPEILNELRVETARALVAATDNDLVNLSAALNARAVRPEMRVVVRLFDPEFAQRVQGGLGMRFTRSVSHLAAPAFAAAVYGSEVVASVPVGDRRVVLFARLRVGPGSVLSRRRAEEVDRPGVCRLLAIGDGTAWTWSPAADMELRPETALLVATTRAGLAQLLDEAQARVARDGESS
jgi:voltage-gated potassium channel Kch